VDFSPVREIYLHSSLGQQPHDAHQRRARLHRQDSHRRVLTARLCPYRYLGPTDAISCSDANFRTISFQLRDFAGNSLTPGSFVVIELAFLDTDPYTM
jgi:hypothetical protein